MRAELADRRLDRLVNELDAATCEREDGGHVTRSRGASCLRQALSNVACGPCSYSDDQGVLYTTAGYWCVCVCVWACSSAEF